MLSRQPHSRPSFLLSQSQSSRPSSVAFPSAPSPSPPPAVQVDNIYHSRRKTYGGDLNGITKQLVLGYEQRIAALEANESEIPIDPVDERAIRRQSTLVPASLASTALDLHITEQSDLLYERKLRMEILETLKKIRGQNALLSRSAREYKEKCTSLTDILETEREQRQHMEEELKRLSQINFTLLEHNKLLVGRDSALQEDISTLITKSQADDWMRNVLEDELRLARHSSPEPQQSNHPIDPVDRRNSLASINFSPEHESLKRRSMAITLEHSGPLRAQLTTARDELHVTQRQLAESEKKCADLTDRISALQHNMTQCVDSSTQALEVERELRAEVAERAIELEDENLSLRNMLADLRLEIEQLKENPADGNADQLPDENTDIAEPITVDQTHDSSHPDDQIQPQQEHPLALQARKVTFDEGSWIGGQLRTKISSKKLCHERNKYLLSPKAPGCPPTLAGSLYSPSRSSSLEFPDTPDSSSTLVDSPIPSSRHTPHSSKDSSRRFFRPRPLSLTPDSTTLSLVSRTIVHPCRSPPPIPATPPLKGSKSLTLLTTTLSRQSPSFQFQTTALKTDSTLFIDVTNDVTDPRIVDEPTKRRRASAVLSSIARTYAGAEGINEWVRV